MRNDDEEDFREAFRLAYREDRPPELTPFLKARVLHAAVRKERLLPRKGRVYVLALYAAACAASLEVLTGGSGVSLMLAPAAIAVWMGRRSLLERCSPFLRLYR